MSSNAHGKRRDEWKSILKADPMIFSGHLGPLDAEEMKTDQRAPSPPHLLSFSTIGKR